MKTTILKVLHWFTRVLLDPLTQSELFTSPQPKLGRDPERRLSTFLFCPVSSESLSANLGLAEYSYAFVQKHFEPVLSAISGVTIVSTLDESLRQKMQAMERDGQACRLICFCPPQCVPASWVRDANFVIAWEFDSIPDQTLDKLRSGDWVDVLTRCSGVIALSSHSKRVIEEGIQYAKTIEHMPIPLSLDTQSITSETSKKVHSLTVSPEDLVIDVRPLNTESRLQAISSIIRPAQWDFTPIQYTFSAGTFVATLQETVDFNSPEGWGMWSKVDDPSIILPIKLLGACRIRIGLIAVGDNIDRNIQVEIGGASHALRLSQDLEFHEFVLDIGIESNIMRLLGVTSCLQPRTRDHRYLGVAVTTLEIKAEDVSAVTVDKALCKPDWNRQDYFAETRLDALCHSDLKLVHFHSPESWGVWSASDQAQIHLPFCLTGHLVIELVLGTLEDERQPTVSVRIAQTEYQIVVDSTAKPFAFTIDTTTPFSSITLCNIKHTQPINSDDTRLLGLSLRSISIKALDHEVPIRGNTHSTHTTELRQFEFKDSEVVYVSVFNPADRRKNWRDLLTAFCYALGDKSDATLVLKLTHVDVAPNALAMIAELGHFKSLRCRIIIIGAFLSSADYNQLIARSNYYVNASHGEGLCIPSLEFMGQGTPSIAPNHTAMQDYVSNKNSFVVESSLEITNWPQDPLARYTTRQYRIHWQSLASGLESSYQCFRFNPKRYAKLANNAHQTVQTYCDPGSVEIKLRQFLETHQD